MIKSCWNCKHSDFHCGAPRRKRFSAGFCTAPVDKEAVLRILPASYGGTLYALESEHGRARVRNRDDSDANCNRWEARRP